MKLTALPILLLLVITSLGVSCKKKDTKPVDTTTYPNPYEYDTVYVDNYINDTIFPSDYLMTYPGSEWNYDDGTTVTCDAWENVAVSTTVFQSPTYTVTRSYHVVPHCSSEPIYISGSNYLDMTDPMRSRIVGLVDTTVGEFYEDSYVLGEPYPGSYVHVSRSVEVVEKLPFMEVLSVSYPDVIHVRKHMLYYDGDHEFPYTYDYYYAKHVGLIRYTDTYLPNDPPQSEKNLVNYTIGPH